MFCQAVTFFVGLPAIWSGANPYPFYKSAAWVVSAYAAGECAGFFLAQELYTRQAITLKRTMIYALSMSVLAAVLFTLTFSPKGQLVDPEPLSRGFTLLLIIVARFM